MRLDYSLVIFKLEERHEKGLAAFDDVENEIMEKFFEPSCNRDFAIARGATSHSQTVEPIPTAGIAVR